MGNKYLIAVYGTLKKGFRNHSVMERAKGKYVGEGHVGVESLKNVGFPCAKFDPLSNKRLMVEIYEVEREGVLNCLDRLEGYQEGREDNHYNRIAIPCVMGTSECSVHVYDYNRSLEKDDLNDYILNTEGDKTFYSWK